MADDDEGGRFAIDGGGAPFRNRHWSEFQLLIDAAKWQWDDEPPWTSTSERNAVSWHHVRIDRACQCARPGDAMRRQRAGSPQAVSSVRSW